jgi:uncharacterized protein YeaO (DUF488 family)|tara:strand:- start:332 stop:508 length:177 start_codon:yes stop_codon:yes gene_type:complete
METNEMMKKMATTCQVLNRILRDDQKYEELKKRYDELEKNGKMHKMNDLYNLCEEFDS